MRDDIDLKYARKRKEKQEREPNEKKVTRETYWDNDTNSHIKRKGPLTREEG